MKATVTLELKTREVHHLFERRINGDRLFINAILHKFNRITGQCRKRALVAEETYQSIEKNILTLTQQFSDEIRRFREILVKKIALDDKKIKLIPSFHPKINIETPLTVLLIELIETYDNYVATLKLLHLVGCFESEQDYYANITRIQKKINRMLSEITFT